MISADCKLRENASNSGYTQHMFVRRLAIRRVDGHGARHDCPIRWIDNFAMRNFTNDAVFDDTLPIADGLLEAGHRVPLDRLRPAMEDWFRRKGYLAPGDALEIAELPRPEPGNPDAPRPEPRTLSWLGRR